MLGNLILEQSASPSNLATINLSGAVTGRVTMRSQLGNGAACFYHLFDATIFEIGIGTLSHGTPDTLTRTTVLYNSSGTTSRINFPGTVYVTNYIPAERAVYRDASNNLTLPAALTVTGNINGVDLAVTGNINGAALGVTGDISGADLWMTGNVDGATGTFSGNVTAATPVSPTHVMIYNQTAFSSTNPGAVVTPRGYKRVFGRTSGTVSSNLMTVSYGAQTLNLAHSATVCNGEMGVTTAMCGLVSFGTSSLQIYVVGYSSGPYTVNWSVDGEA